MPVRYYRLLPAFVASLSLLLGACTATRVTQPDAAAAELPNVNQQASTDDGMDTEGTIWTALLGIAKKTAAPGPGCKTDPGVSPGIVAGGDRNPEFRQHAGSARSGGPGSPVTEWYSPKDRPNERIRVTAFVKARALRSDSIVVTVERQTRTPDGQVAGRHGGQEGRRRSGNRDPPARARSAHRPPASDGTNNEAPGATGQHAARSRHVSGYNFRESEAKWQRCWQRARAALRPSSTRRGRNTTMLEHVSSTRRASCMSAMSGNYTMGDLVARFRRAQGFNVLHPMGWDAFGLPAENAAIAGGIHPAVWTAENIATMRAQLERMGFAYDWSREIATCHPQYYRHEQKMFLDFLAKDLAYRRESWVNWDPVENTVLANEQVIEGRGWRSGAVVEKRLLSQWFLRITRYSDELLDALTTLDRWPERVRLMQEKWIGRSEGARVRWALAGRDAKTEVFTTFGRRWRYGAASVPRFVAAPSARPETGGDGSRGSPPLYRRMRPGRHQRRGDRNCRETRLRHRRRGDPPARQESPRAGLCRQFRADGIWHRRHLRLPGARPARISRLRPQIRGCRWSPWCCRRARIPRPSRLAIPPMSRTGRCSIRVFSMA